MQVKYYPIKFNLNSILDEELPFMSAFYRERLELNSDVRDLLAFPMNNSHAMPFYTLRAESVASVMDTFDSFYLMMMDALNRAFKDKDLLYKYFDCAFLRKWGNRFIPYAEYTLYQKHPALYGRFDARFNPHTEKVEGVYEFNGDTPVMLFESVNLQNIFSEQLKTDQYNGWWHASIDALSRKYKNVAVACDTHYVEDMATCETIAQVFQSAKLDSNVFFLDLKELDFDHAHKHKPFVARESEKYLDAVYILSPWEEMIENFPAMLGTWEDWADNVHIFEPAWRWFLSNKGMMALCTHLMEEDDRFHALWGSLPLIPTYLTPEPFYGNSKCVEKPVVGRLSNNIKILSDRGFMESTTGGFYQDDNKVYQLYQPPYKVEGRNNFILGMWMSGRGGRIMDASTMCIREFDDEVLSISNERFIPHIVDEDE